MPLNYPRLFSNPTIPSGQYLAQVIHVSTYEVKTASGLRTALEVEIEIDHFGPAINGKRLWVILQPTDKGERFIAAFLESYRVGMGNLQDSVGRWASVHVSESTYSGSSHSIVRFQHQTAAARQIIAEIEAESAQSKRRSGKVSLAE